MDAESGEGSWVAQLARVTAQGHLPGSPQANRSCWWEGAEFICTLSYFPALGHREASSG